MATQTGPFIFKGKIQNTRGYTRIKSKKKFVGVHGGPTKTEFLTLPSLANMRANAKESEACFAAGAVLDNLLLGKNFSKAGNTSKGELIAACKQLIKLDLVKPVGERDLLFSSGAADATKLFEGKCFSYYNFSSILNANYVVEFNVPAHEFGIQIVEDIYPGAWNMVPAAANKFKLEVRVLFISDYIYSPTAKKYYPIAAPQYESASSGWHSIDPGIVAPTYISANIISPTPTGVGIFINSFITFAKFVNGVDYVLKQYPISKIIRFGSN
jgi:hypothetical protein